MDHYRLLGVAPSATYEEIRASYRRLARAHHPDAVGANGAVANFDMAALNEAWHVLSDPVRRGEYDRRLAAPAAPRATAPPPAAPPERDVDDDMFDDEEIDTAGTRAWMVLITFTLIAASLVLTALFVYAFIRSGSTTR